VRELAAHCPAVCWAHWVDGADPAARVAGSALKIPAYTHTQALTGGAILVVACLAVLVALLVAWWRRR
jgi:hypothetical protein